MCISWCANCMNLGNAQCNDKDLHYTTVCTSPTILLAGREKALQASHDFVIKYKTVFWIMQCSTYCIKQKCIRFVNKDLHYSNIVIVM